MKFSKFAIGIAFILLSSVSFAQSIYNYLGTGSPRLQLILSSNGPNWGTFTIDYQGNGNVPTPSPYTASNDWSSWNVKDTSGNYYGSITLAISSSNVISFTNYVAPSPATGYYLDGITFCVPNSSQTVCGDKVDYSLMALS